MRRAEVSMHGIPAGILEEIETGNKYRFTYFKIYNGPSIALTMPVDGSTLNSSNRPEQKPGLTACGGVDQAFPIVVAGEYDSRQLLAREVGGKKRISFVLFNHVKLS